MKNLIILGGGTAGTMMANKLARALDRGWQITVVDRSDVHYYQPGSLLMPFGVYSECDVRKPRRDFLPPDVRFVQAGIDRIDAEHNLVMPADGTPLRYDWLIVATGTHIRPDQTEGLLDEEWHRMKIDFYTVAGAARLRHLLDTWPGGRLVVNVTEMPIKCPVAPLEFLFLADSYFREKGMRDKVELTYVTPLPGAFTKPKAPACSATSSPGAASTSCRSSLSPVSIARKRRSSPGTKPKCLTTCWSPCRSIWGMKPSAAVAWATISITSPPISTRSGTRRSPTSSSSATPPTFPLRRPAPSPTSRPSPLPAVGPFSLLKEPHINHYGKLLFRWVYWHVLLRGLELPIGAHMSMAGKAA